MRTNKIIELCFNNVHLRLISICEIISDSSIGQSMIIGAVLGSVVMIALMAAALVLIMKKRKKANTQKHRDHPRPGHNLPASNI